MATPIEYGTEGKTVEQYTNRQGNTVTVDRGPDGRVLSVEVSGKGSHRAFSAQLRVASRKAHA